MRRLRLRQETLVLLKCADGGFFETLLSHRSELYVLVLEKNCSQKLPNYYEHQ